MSKVTTTPLKKYDPVPATGTPGTQFEAPDVTPSTNNVHNPKILTANSAWGVSVGDSVHYVNVLGKHCAATIEGIEVAESCEVNLAVLQGITGAPATIHPTKVVYDASGKKRGTWHWPEGTVLNPR